MFRKQAERLNRLLSLLDDVLGDPEELAPSHPHRHPLRWQPPRRSGSVPQPHAHCISPVRPVSTVPRRRERAGGREPVAR